MDDRKLYYICLSFSALSMAALLLFVQFTEPEEVSISSIGRNDIGKEVIVEGRIGDRYLSDEGHFFFHVKENGTSINSVIFKDDFEEMDMSPEMLQNGKTVKITGEIGIHKNELQIIPEEIVL